MTIFIVYVCSEGEYPQSVPVMVTTERHNAFKFADGCGSTGDIVTVDKWTDEFDYSCIYHRVVEEKVESV